MATKKKNKNKVIYNIVKWITLILPTSLYLLISAIVFQVHADIEINNFDVENVYKTYTNEEDVKGYNIYILFEDMTNETTISGDFEVYDNGLSYTSFENFVVKINDELYTFEVIDDNSFKFVEVSSIQVKKEQGWKIPLAFFMSLFAVGIVALVVMGKMQIAKQYPRTATLVSLILGSVILYVINLIVSSLFNVFLIATVSWLLYCIEYMVYKNSLNGTRAERLESDVARILKGLLNE